MTPDSSLSNLPALLLAALLAACLWADVRRDLRRLVSGRNVVLLAIFVWFLLEAIRLPAALAVYSPSQYNFGLLCVALAAAAFLAAYHATRAPLFDRFGARLRLLDNPRLLWILFLVALAVGLAPALYFAGFDLWAFIESALGYRKRWSGSNPLARARYGGFRDALLELKMFLKPALIFAVILLVQRGVPAGRRLVCALFVLWSVLVAVFSGSRGHLLVAAGPVLAALYWKLSPRWQRRALLALPLVFFVAYTWAAAVVVTRHSGDFTWSAAARADYVGFEMFRELLFISANIPEKLDYQWGHTYYVQLVNPVPRFLWPGKPAIDAGLLMARAHGAFNKQGTDVFLSSSPGIIGEMYLNFGLPGVLLLSALGGCLVRSWDRLGPLGRRSLPAFLVYCGGLAILVEMGRSVNMSMFYGMLALTALLLCIPLRPSRSPVLAAPRRHPVPSR